MEPDLSLLERLPPLREIIAAHGLRAEKKLGQNFLLDLNLTDKIARQISGLERMNVIEIGPGPGGLTRSLLRQNAKSVCAVEYDLRAVEALGSLKVAAQGRLRIVHADALETDVRGLAEAPRGIAANLPYNIATPLLVKWLRDLHAEPAAYSGMVLMFQKEVAERITASPGTKVYGRLSVLSQWICDVKKLFDVPPSAFTPAPKVVSSVVKFTPKAAGKDRPPIDAVEVLTAAAFGQRRKMLRSSLSAYAPLFESCGINPTLRAENLAVEDFIALARASL